MIKLSRVRVMGFRLLEDVTVTIEHDATVIVGRNNSGKTSLTEVFDKFLGDQIAQFRLEDFSAATRLKFLSAKALRESAEGSPESVVAALPVIALDLTFNYEVSTADLGSLSPFIIDLDPSCTKAIARIEYSPSIQTMTALLDTPAVGSGADPNHALFHHLRQAIPKAYSIKTFAIDPTDATNRREFDKSGPLSALLHIGFVKAQRTLDMGKRGDTDVIGRLLNKLFRTANTQSASAGDQEIAAQLKASVAHLETSMQGDFDTQLKGLLPALSSFGFPSLNDTEL